MSDDDECRECGASKDYEFGEIEFESGLSDEQKESLTKEAIKNGEYNPSPKPDDAEKKATAE